MLNFIIEPASLLGILVGFVMLLFYLILVTYPKLAFQEDIFIITLGLVYSCIILIHGWRLDPILVFAQGVIVSILLISGWSSLRLRALVHVLNLKNN
mmetsp:Transcript_2831/g.9809  ORF Transcript_2831/g.9809 Transcript_2831/m.9809 type:complete len:97 (-) Transcript_2831:1465-1755(-)